jgi:hypothetical protein
MMDDDMAGFYAGWWEELIRPLEDPNVLIVSARLTKATGENGLMMFDGDTIRNVAVVPRVPTACIAFRNTDIRFDEEYLGSGFEDDDFCAQLTRRYPHGRFVINNRVRLIHLNEQKEQGRYFEANRARFYSKWLTTKDERRLDHNYNIPKRITVLGADGEMPRRDVVDQLMSNNPHYEIEPTKARDVVVERLLLKYDKADSYGKRLIASTSALLSGGWVVYDDECPPVCDKLCREVDISCGALLMAYPTGLHAVAAVRDSAYISSYLDILTHHDAEFAAMKANEQPLDGAGEGTYVVKKEG